MKSRGCSLVLSALVAVGGLPSALAAPHQGSPSLDGGRVVRRLALQAAPAGARLAEGTRSLDRIEELPIPLSGSALLTFDARSRRLLVLDPSRSVLLGFGESDVTRVDTRSWGILDPRGIASDPATGDLWILDGGGRRLVLVVESELGTFGPGRTSRTPSPMRTMLRLPGPSDWRGLALDPTSGHLVTLSPSGRVLYELRRDGGLIAAHRLPRVRLVDPRGLAFAPSGDRTDDPSVCSLYVLDAGAPSAAPGPAARESGSTGSLIEIAFAGPPGAPPAPLGTTPTLVGTIDTSALFPPSPDPSGIAYRAETGGLVFVDGEVDEMPLWSGVNVWEIAPTGAVLDTAGTLSFSREPTDIAIDPVSGRWFLTDDGKRRIFAVDRGPDGRLGTADDAVTWFSTSAFGSDDPEGLTYDTLRGHLFIADGLNAEIYEVDPGANGLFDGIPPSGDDIVGHFDTASLGHVDPEGVEYNADADTLFIVSRGSRQVLETTPTGVVLRAIDIGFLTDLIAAAGVAHAPSSADPSVMSLYILDRAVDNNVDPNENDGKIYEITIPPPPVPGSVIDARIAAGSDDAEERASGGMTLGSSYIDMVDDTSNQTVGLRFADLAIDPGTRVANAWIQFTTGKVTVGPASLLVRGQAADDSPTFTSSHRDISSRPRTAASIVWEPDPWSTLDLAGLPQRTPDLAWIVQEIVDRPGWARGNAIALIVTGTGVRSAQSWERDAAAAAWLHVELVTPYCGDGILQDGEECDGADLRGATCPETGCGGGPPACTALCVLDFAACTPCSTCGNGVLEEGEACDGADLGDATCASRGYGSGTLSCADDCVEFDESACSVCNGNGACDPGENCYVCPSECASAGPICGNRICESANGENCRTCPTDCPGSETGPPGSRFCCGDDAGTSAFATLNSRCSTVGGSVSVLATAVFCCGNGACESGEDASICAVDCAP